MYREAAESAVSEQQQLPDVVETAPQPAGQQPDTQAGEPCSTDFIMVALCYRADHYIFAL